jgi:hypothetical protein
VCVSLPRAPAATRTLQTDTLCIFFRKKTTRSVIKLKKGTSMYIYSVIFCSQRKAV